MALSKKRTQPFCLGSWPLRAIRVQVVAGPSNGASATAVESLSIGTAKDNDLVLADPTVSRFHAELVRTPNGVEVLDRDSTNGTWVGRLRIIKVLVAPGTTLTLGASQLTIGDGEECTVPLYTDNRFAELRGSSPVMRRLFAKAERAAQSQAPVLITGELGTGKSQLARVLHDLGSQAQGPFVSVCCTGFCQAIRPTRASLGGEQDEQAALEPYREAWEQARGGTLFLDEIGEIPPSHQALLVHLLESSEARQQTPPVRLVCASHQDLRAAVNAGNFRPDLYHRLAVLTLAVPPLRERAADIPLLINNFLALCGRTESMEELFSPELLEALSQHSWPGNVRELRNIVEAAATLGETDTPGEMAPREVLEASVRVDDAVLEMPYGDARSRALQAFEASYLAALMRRANGNISQAARFAGMDRSHLSQLLRRHGLRPPSETPRQA
jgi:DNA-binding NtrC family response regulator